MLQYSYNILQQLLCTTRPHAGQEQQHLGDGRGSSPGVQVPCWVWQWTPAAHSWHQVREINCTE